MNVINTPKKFISNYYLYFFPLGFLLFLAGATYVQVSKLSNDNTVVFYYMLIFLFGFFIVLMLFLSNSKVLYLHADGIIEKNFMLKERTAIYYEHVSHLEIENLSISKPWTYFATMSNSYEIRSLTFHFIDGRKFEMRFGAYLKGDEIRALIERNFHEFIDNKK